MAEIDPDKQTTGDWFGTYQPKTSSMQYSLDEMSTRVVAYDNPRLEQKLDEAIALTNEAAEKEYAYERDRDDRRSARRGAVETDNKIDRTISTIHNVAKATADSPAECDQKACAEKLLDEVFPNGVYPITSKDFEEQRMHVRELLDELNGEYRKDIETLGLEAQVETLESLYETFDEQLGLADHEEVTYDEVQAARSEAREAFHQVVAVVLGNYCDDQEALDDLMEPVLHQQRKIARHVKRRGEIPPVDPESGEPTEPTGPQDGESPRDGGTPVDENESEESETDDSDGDGNNDQPEG
jgi:hypothetical protein